MNLSIPPEKIDKLLSLIRTLKSKGTATKKELELLGGLLSHFSSVVRGGRTVCRRVYDLFSRCQRGKRIKIDEDILLDLSWWERLCSVFNGSAKIISKGAGGTFTTDASTWGFGGWSDGDWFLGCWDGTPPPPPPTL